MNSNSTNQHDLVLLQARVDARRAEREEAREGQAGRVSDPVRDEGRPDVTLSQVVAAYARGVSRVAQLERWLDTTDRGSRDGWTTARRKAVEAELVVLYPIFYPEFVPLDEAGGGYDDSF